MADVKTWALVAADNADAAPDGAPENHPRVDVNDITRENMRGVREQLQDSGWFDRFKGPSSKGFTIVKTDASNVKFTHEGTPTDASGYVKVGDRVRVESSGPVYVYGFVSAVAYVNPDTTVTIDFDGASVVPTTPTAMDVAIAADSVGNVAYSPIGSTLAQDPPEIPSIDLLGDGALLNQGSGNGFDADKLDGFDAVEIIAAGAGPGISLINGNFQVSQRGPTFTQSTFYPNDNGVTTLDGWVLLQGNLTAHPGAGSGVVDLSIVDAGSAASIPAPTAVRMTANASIGGAPVEKVGLIQWLPHDACRHLISGSVSLSAYARNGGSGIDGARVALVQWNGAPDVLSALDPINDWGAVDVTPTVLGSFTIAVSSKLALTTAWQEMKLENTSVAAGTKNIGILVYVDDTSYANTNWCEFTSVHIGPGAVAGEYVNEDFALNLQRCRRFCYSSFDHDGVVADNQGFASGAARYDHADGNGDGVFTFDFASQMFKTPTIKVFNPGSATADRIWDDTTSAEVAIVSNVAGRGHCGVKYDAASSSDDLYCNVIATAELV